MEQTRKLLLKVLGLFLLILICIVAIYELPIFLPGCLAGKKSLTFVQFIMQPITLLLIPLALYLFKIHEFVKVLLTYSHIKDFKYGLACEFVYFVFPSF